MFHDSALTSEQKMVRDLLEELSRPFPYPYFLKKMRSKEFPEEFFHAFTETGLFGIEVPEELGGSQGSLRDFAVLLYFLGRFGFFSFHLLEQFTVTHLLSGYGTEEQKATILPSLLKGERVALYLLEDETGEEILPSRTTLLRQNGSYILSGEKLFVSCPEESAYALVVARMEKSDSSPRRRSDLALVLLPREKLNPEVEVRDLNLRVVEEREERQITGDLFAHARFSRVPVDYKEIIRGEEPFHVLLHHLFLGMASGFCGISDAVIAKGVEWANQRVIFTEPIASYQAIQHPFVRAKTEVEMAKLLIERAVDASEEPYSPSDQLEFSALAKYQALEASFQAFDISMQAHGGGAFDRDTGILPFWTLMLFASSYALHPQRILRSYGERLVRSL
jgi:alkylation response protein AidB-like acyl-CoA dehydrogenase